MKKKQTIKETLNDLEVLERRHCGTAQASRIQMLRLIKEGRVRTHEDTAKLLGYSVSTIKRWWKVYCNGSIDALLGFRGECRRSAGNIELLEKLRWQLNSGVFSNLVQVQQWIHLNEPRVVKECPSLPPLPNANKQSKIEINDTLVQFLNGLPTSTMPVQWTDLLHKILTLIIPEIDKYATSININCDIVNPKDYNPGMRVTRVVSLEKVSEALVDVNETGPNDDPIANSLSQLKKSGFPFHLYYTPSVLPISYQGAFLGNIYVFRERTKPPLSHDTIELLNRLHPFFEFMLSDCVARFQVAKRAAPEFNTIISEIIEEYELPLQEFRVFVLQLLGMTYKQIAVTMNISIDTVRHYVKSVHNRTGERSSMSLFAQYFSLLRGKQ